MDTQRSRATPKGNVSSRLLAMGFMQRGAASASSSPKNTHSGEQHSAKRRKVTNGSTQDTPDTPVGAVVDQQAIKRVLDEEQKRREALVEKQAAEMGDAHWVLEHATVDAALGNDLPKPLKVVQVGFAHLDYHDAKDDGSPQYASQQPSDVPKRRRYNMKPTEASQPHGTRRSASADSSEEDDSSSDLSRKQPRGSIASAPEKLRKRALSEDSRSAGSPRSAKRPDKRVKTTVDLKTLNSISSSGGPSPTTRGVNKQTRCFSCGGMGHIANKCPTKDKH